VPATPRGASAVRCTEECRSASVAGYLGEKPESSLRDAARRLPESNEMCTLMKRTLLILVAAAGLATGARSQDADVDNTGGGNKDQPQTAEHQSNDQSDIKLAAQIRKLVVDDEALSMTARNVKIITANGAVTLRGPVETEKEKAAIEAHARQVGAKEIINELEVKRS
jgi:hyperosmotically inducible periplasmic protein